MTGPSSKKARTQPPYELLYHPSIPGRGEYIRIALEATKTPYTDPANTEPNGNDKVRSLLSSTNTYDSSSNPPIFAPPALRVAGDGPNDKTLLISQTPNILLYLGPKIGLAPSDDEDQPTRLHINQLTLTALDLSNEVHDVHHPINVMDYYEDQKEEALRKSVPFREQRLPKFLEYFERVLRGNREVHGGGEGRYLVGEKLTYADTTLWQVVDG